jgi:serine O-acetyltransferase
MIKSYQDYLHYLEADRTALGRKRTLKSLLFDDIWKFQRLMRKLEYPTNCNKNIFRKLLATSDKSSDGLVIAKYME